LNEGVILFVGIDVFCVCSFTGEFQDTLSVCLVMKLVHILVTVWN